MASMSRLDVMQHALDAQRKDERRKESEALHQATRSAGSRLTTARLPYPHVRSIPIKLPLQAVVAPTLQAAVFVLLVLEGGGEQETYLKPTDAHAHALHGYSTPSKFVFQTSRRRTSLALYDLYPISEVRACNQTGHLSSLCLGACAWGVA